jgi:hypothetical protein
MASGLECAQGLAPDSSEARTREPAKGFIDAWVVQCRQSSDCLQTVTCVEAPPAVYELLDPADVGGLHCDAGSEPLQ